MILIRYLAFCIFYFYSIQLVSASDSWMNLSMNSLKGFFGCVEVPRFPGYDKAEETLSLDNAGQWTSTGVEVDEGKLLKMDWKLENATIGQTKYRVMYRIDPRFARPQIFIQKFNHHTNKYESDFHHFKNGQLVRYQDVPEMTFDQRIIDYTDYVNFNGRSGIKILAGDVININLDHNSTFFSSDSEMDRELGRENNADLLSISTRVPGGDNRIFYNNIDEFCQTINPAHSNYAINCQTITGKYWDVGENWDSYVGNMTNDATNNIWQNAFICTNSATGRDNQPVCNYDQGRGMIIAISGTEIKSETESFVHSDFSNQDFFYHRSDSNGFLEFKSPWLISDIYSIADQLMIDWGNSGATDYLEFYNHMTTLKPSIAMNYLYMGRYLMEIEIGNSTNQLTVDSLRDLNVEYYISDNGAPPETATGTAFPHNYRDNASSNGYLWLRVLNKNTELSGDIKVRITSYSGTVWFSDVIGNKIIAPIRNKFQELSELIFRKIVNNTGFKNILRASLTLYIAIYALMFLAGAVQITVSDIVSRVVKIAIVVALLTETSWRFFNDNLFILFTQGTEYFIALVSGSTSSVDNMFGFIDPLIKRYLNWEIWLLLLAQLLQIQSGLFVLSIMSIYAIIIYFKTALQIIIGYCIAIICISVMISLAPLFIMLILFERTKSMFDSWLSMLLSQMLQPMLLMIFFLLIDQILSELILRLVVRACWDTLVSLFFHLDLNHLSIPLSFPFSIPFLSEISFYVPQIDKVTNVDDFFSSFSTIPAMITATFIFLIFVKFTGGLMEYTNSIGQAITGAAPPRKNDRHNKSRNSQNPVDDIMGDMKKVASPVTGSAEKMGGFMKDKLIDQKIDRKASTTNSGKINYGGSVNKDSDADGGGDDKVSKKSTDSINAGRHKITDGKSEQEKGKTDLSKTITIGSHRNQSTNPNTPIIGSHRNQATNSNPPTIGSHRNQAANSKALTQTTEDKKRKDPTKNTEVQKPKIEKVTPIQELRSEMIIRAKNSGLNPQAVDLLDKAVEQSVKFIAKRAGIQKQDLDEFGKSLNEGITLFNKSRNFSEKDVDRLVVTARKNINKLEGKYDLTQKDTQAMGDIAEAFVRKGAKMYDPRKTQQTNTINTFPRNHQTDRLKINTTNEARSSNTTQPEKTDRPDYTNPTDEKDKD